MKITASTGFGLVFILYIFLKTLCARARMCVYACAPVLWRLRSKKTSRSQGSLFLDHVEPENGTEVRPNIEHLLWCLGSPPNGTCKETLSHILQTTGYSLSLGTCPHSL